MPVYSGFIAATARVRCDAFSVEADTLELAIAKAKAEGTDPYVFGFDDSSDLDGDVMAYIDRIDGEPIDETVEIDIPEPGVPDTIEARGLAMELSKLALADCDTGMAEQLIAIVARAKAICNMGDAS